jgi:hypothetical protein
MNPDRRVKTCLHLGERQINRNWVLPVQFNHTIARRPTANNFECIRFDATGD